MNGLRLQSDFGSNRCQGTVTPPEPDLNLHRENINQLPMFKPLDYQSTFPRKTLFSAVPFYQAQGKIKRINNCMDWSLNQKQLPGLPSDLN